MLKDYVFQLKRNLLFKNLEQNQILDLMNCLKPTISRYKSGEFIALSGDVMTNIGVLVSGEINISKETASGDVMIISKLKEGDLFGEVAALSGLCKAPANVIAKTDCVVLFLNPANFLNKQACTCNSYHQFIQNMIMTLARKAYRLNKKIDYLVIKSLRGKICAYLSDAYREKNSTEISLPFNRNDFAEFLYVSRPSLSRELSRMRDEGIIEFKGNNIEILNLDAVTNGFEVE